MHTITLGGQRYAIGSEIGRGAEARVHHCTETETGRAGVLRLQSFARELDAELMRQAALLRELDSPHIVPILCAGTTLPPAGSGTYIIVMPHIGVTLYDVLKHQVDHACLITHSKDYVRQIWAGIAYLHAKELAHYDISPLNVLVDSSNSVRLCDLARCGPRRTTQPNHLYGLPYRPPECYTGGNVGPPADCWAGFMLTYETIMCEPLILPDRSCAGTVAAADLACELKARGACWPNQAVVDSVAGDAELLELAAMMLHCDPSVRAPADRALHLFALAPPSPATCKCVVF